MLDHGADPSLVAGDLSAIQIAARRGRADALDLFLNRGIALNLSDMDYLVAGCALNDAEAINTAHDPALIEELHRQAGPILAGFASMGNTIGLHNLISLGLDINTPFIEGDGYFDIAPNSSALHVAAWRGRHDTVKYLIEAGANVNTRDGKQRTPLTLAVRACVDSYWTARRAPDSVAALLNAGAAAGDITLPTGYPEVDRLLQNHRPAS
jgi:ankyrin repeat protein